MGVTVYYPMRVNAAGDTVIMRQGVDQIEIGSGSAIKSSGGQLDLNSQATLNERLGANVLELYRRTFLKGKLISLNDAPTTQNLAAVGNQIVNNETSILYLGNTSGGNLVLTSTPTIDAGTTGQVLALANTNPNFSITIQDNANLAGSNVFNGVAAIDMLIAPNRGALFIYLNTRWLCMGAF